VLKRRLLSLTASAIVAVSATVLAALPATTASATTPVTPSIHFTPALNIAGLGATAPHVRGVVHVVRRGLVKDCEYITTYLDDGIDIGGNGVNKPVTLQYETNCFNLYNEFYYSTGGQTWTGYEYQNGDGHCLWNDGGTLELGAACQAAHPNEEFFGEDYDNTVGGWLFSNVTDGPDSFVTTTSKASCDLGANVYVGIPGAYSCYNWNFPSN
jgi:hypothetical protein